VKSSSCRTSLRRRGPAHIRIPRPRESSLEFRARQDSIPGEGETNDSSGTTATSTSVIARNVCFRAMANLSPTADMGRSSVVQMANRRTGPRTPNGALEIPRARFY
jgi:hypothetical protein